MNALNCFRQKLLPAICIVIGLYSCTSSNEVPFPEKELGYSQPVSAPLQFNAPVKIKWETARSGAVKPVVKHLDIAALPASVYDSNSFQPFLKAPEEVSFDFKNLPEKIIDLSKLPSKKIQFKTSLIPPAPAVTALPPVQQKNRSIAIADLGGPQGLPAKFITSLLRDDNGLMLIASQEGIFEYDGQKIQTLLPANPNAGIVGGMALDKQGKLWYVTTNRTIGVIDRQNGTLSVSNAVGGYRNNITNITKDQEGNFWLFNSVDTTVSIINPETGTYRSLSKKEGLQDKGVFEIIEDAEKNIWISSFTAGLLMINPKTGISKYFNNQNGLSCDSLMAIKEDKNGHIWVANAKAGIDEIDVKAGKIKHYTTAQGINEKFKFRLFFDEYNRLWVTDPNGVLLLDLVNNQYRNILPKDGLFDGNVLSITTDLQKRIWLGTRNGLNIIDNGAASAHMFGTTQAISTMQDITGNVWLATDKGIRIINTEKNQIRTFNKTNGLSDDFIQSFGTFNNKIWITSDGGLEIIDPVNKTLEHMGKKEGLVNDTIYVVLKDMAGNTWLTGPSNGVDLIDSAKKTIRHADRKLGLSDNTILDVKEDNDGRVWLANRSKGIDVYDHATGEIKNLNNQPGLKDVCNKMMLKDGYGRMWVGTDKGIYVIDNKLGTITPITVKEGLSSDRVLSVLAYQDKILVGTNKAVNIITTPAPAYAKGSDTSNHKWKIETLRKSTNLTRELATAWSTDAITREGVYLWGDVGMSIIHHFQVDTDSFPTHITGLNVMATPQYFVNQYESAASDTVWTSDSFYIKGQKPLPMGYTSNHDLHWDSVTGAYNIPVNLVIPHTSNYLQFHYAQANAGRRDTTWYTYILEGIDKKWSLPTSSISSENYLNLPPGHYTFKVSSKAPDGKWGAPATFSFIISPPWYNTWWAYLIFILLGIGILRVYIIYRSRMLQKENRILEEKVAHRTQQLQKSLEDLKSTQTQLIQSEKMASLGELTAGIAHEIQNPLNFINNFSEVNTELIEEMQQEIEKGNLPEVKAIANDIKENEQKITFHGKRADGIVKGMLQHSRNNTGTKEPTNINTLADEYLRLAYHGLRAKDKSFNATMQTDFDEHIGSINIVSQDIGRVILNLITNAFYAVTDKKKKGIEGYIPTVFVGTKRTPDKIMITVRDNGMGIPQKVIDKIFQPFFSTKPTGEGTGLGLSMSYDIVTKVHHGELKVNTVEGEFAEFTIILPIEQSSIQNT